MRWALTSRFEHNDRELLALFICRDMTVFVVHKGSHRGPRGSLERLRDVPVGPRGVPGRPRSVPGGPRSVPWRPSGVPERPRGVPEGPGGVPWGPRGVPGGPRGVPMGSLGSQAALGTSWASPGSFS